jgi:protein involved in polysaccharide export with SLBB domain
MVTPEGTLDHPLLQTVKVTEIPIAVVKARIVEVLSQLERDPLVALVPLIRISVGGEVRQPNLYSVPAGTTVAQAIAIAGGPGERGRQDRITVIRGERRLRLSLNAPTDKAVETTVQSGDQIVVARGGNFFRDVLTPLTSLTAAVVSLVVVFRQ